MSLFQPLDNRRPIDPQVLEQAMLWAVTLQSGTADHAQQAACTAWRQAAAEHERAWQRLMGIGQDLRSGAANLPARQTRQLLKARSGTSRRTLLKGFAGLGVVTAAGWGARERVLLPQLFSDYHTGTGERRTLRLGSLDLQLDTQTLLDIEHRGTGQQLMLTRGRVWLENGTDQDLAIRTPNGWVRPAAQARLIVAQARDTHVQMLSGQALLQPDRGTPQDLNAGQQTRFDAGHVARPEELAQATTAWIRGQLIAERTPLGEVITELDRYRRGLLRCDPAVAGLLVSGAFSLDHPEASLDLLARTLPVQVNTVLGYWTNVVPA
ncbi:hypothetical protein ASF84_08615 [Pseudomonas sp. Leaf127]|uniref:DUF4880 domain-containing protein n=1 Tax=Pseudomonas sp. Leaf127 TaxID=1736267 RepID=UPI0007035E8E|nr:DUF4880 domain-containing protein [Pseudomonas sp. Leaf127]KQQ57207.1 hypothetical protein ASF84_08615 [Pseudomonas sp. Leaf127]